MARQTIHPNFSAQPYAGAQQPYVTYAVPAGPDPKGYGHKRQSVTVHVILALTTMGLGNWVYAKIVGFQNKYRR